MEHAKLTDVLFPRQLRIESCTQIEQSRDASVNLNGAGAGCQYACQHLQQRSFAAAIFPNDSKPGALLESKRNTIERAGFSGVAFSSPGEDLQQTMLRVRIRVIELGDILDFNSGAILAVI